MILTPLAAGCSDGTSREVVVYTALDEDFSLPIFAEFTRETGIEVLAKYDSESTKSVGLTQAILAEREHPRCDVFWNNELVNMLRLQQADLLQEYDSPVGGSYPAAYRDADGAWYGFAARARVLIVNTDLLAEGERPDSILDLADDAWAGRCAIAKPLAGTTATHAACLFAAWGAERAEEYFRGVKANAAVLAGNKHVALAVASGRYAFGLTDTDDAIIEVERGAPVAIVYPDQGEGQLGTLFIPNTLGIIRGAPHAREAEILVDYLLSPAVEGRLAAGPSAQIPLNPAVAEPPRVESPRTVRPMEVDFAAGADVWGRAARFLRDEFATAD
ncbi:MAG: extracellular solute-binding protein [Planctomycetales bacterium]|nr:extracellular solute-binding protein [Planctomycetales bacterium]